MLRRVNPLMIMSSPYRCFFLFLVLFNKFNISVHLLFHSSSSICGGGYFFSTVCISLGYFSLSCALIFPSLVNTSSRSLFTSFSSFVCISKCLYTSKYRALLNLLKASNLCCASLYICKLVEVIKRMSSLNKDLRKN